MTSAVQKATDDPLFGRGYRATLLVLILLVSAFAYVDRVIVQTLAEPIKKDLGLTDFQFGLLGGLAFAILYSTLGLPIARLAERRDRVTIISVSVAVFSVMSLLCGMATNIWTLFLCRIGVGIGEAGVQAPSTSLIGDHFPPHRRGFALTVMRLGAPVGALLGSVVAAWLARDYGWRVALMLVCAPGIVVAILFRLLLRDPPRGHSDRLAGGNVAAPAASPPRTWEVFAQMFRRPAFRHMLAGLALASMALFAGGAFTAPFFMRVHELPLTTTAFYVAIISTTASTAGMSLGGFGIDFIARRGKRWYALLPCLGIAISVPLYLAGYGLDNHVAAVTLITIAGVFLFFHSVPTLVAFQNMVAPQQRTTAAFVYFFVSTMVGVGFGPPLLGLLSDLFAGASGIADPAAASAIGVRSALLASIGLYAWAALHYGLAARAIAAEDRP
ncbi:MAG: spinster family MFS transporter [Niveispirillum sp.]|uniref:spinster family MFS transporter n=1 Tax=Niveispirillum sp. TaxID=1917217 RepID=UPI00403606BB